MENGTESFPSAMRAEGKDAVLNTICRANMRLDAPTRWEFNTTRALMSQQSPADLLREFRRYSLKEKLADRGAGSIKDSAAGNGGDTTRLEIQGPKPDAGSTPLLHLVQCPVLLTGAKLALYLDAETSTKAIAESLVNVPPGRLEIWVPGSVGEGAMTAKVGAWYKLAGKAFMFLDKQFEIKRPPSSDTA